MKAQILAATTMMALGCGFAATAADSQMLGLVMPDPKVLAGINVDQAKATPFGQYVLSQIAPKEKEFQEIATVLGFDPRRDVRELLVASDPAMPQSGLALARGVFDPQRVTAFATQKGGATELYNGVTIIRPPAGAEGHPVAFAFLDPTLAVFGDLANVKGAIDRRSRPTALGPAMSAKVNEWSTLQDAWMVATIPPSLLKKSPAAQQIPGIQATVIQAVQQAAAGVKFGPTVVLKAQAQTDTPQNATTLAGVLQLLTNLALAQTKADPQVTALAKALVVTATGDTVNMLMSLPATQFEQLIKPKARPAAATAPRGQRVM
jgi:hypothetical protein